ncbi:MAG: hypothetical protein IT173_12505 [Acidobacteria bacterium]|nr:hypothetical protein [Acidobacteriota bacterium]
MIADAVQYRVFQRFGETWEQDATKCPGEAHCDDWAQPWEPNQPTAADELHAAKEEAICRGCPKFESKGMTAGSVPTEEAEDAVDTIENMADWADAGFETDWSCYSFETMQLYQIWRQTEAVLRENRARRMDALVKGFLK